MTQFRFTHEAEWNANAVREQANRAARAEQKMAEMEATIVWMSGELAKRAAQIAALEKENRELEEMLDRRHDQ